MALEFARDIALMQLFNPDIIFVIDIIVVDHHPHILELNSMSCSGWYACNVNKMVSQISDRITREYKENNS